MCNAIISLKPKYVKKILSGEKTVEIRRRIVKLMPGTQLWLYATLPSGSVEAVAEIESILSESPSRIWKKFSVQLGITKQEFDSYVDGCNKVTAITLKAIRKIEPAPSLSYLKSKIGEFHPPQFFARLSKGSPLLKELRTVKDIPHPNNV